MGKYRSKSYKVIETFFIYIKKSKGENIMERASKPRQDLTNQIFGYLTPYEYIKGGKWKCKCKCGNEATVYTKYLKSGHTQSCGCKRKETKNVIDMIGFENEGIKVLERAGSDNSQRALWKCLCKYCGNIFITRGSHIRDGASSSCGCIHSKNEQIITKLLLDNNIEFATQYTFPDLKDERNLRFDFAIFKDGKLSHLIEYNGLQHYQKPDGSWSEGFEILQKHDKMKKDYCKNHNIRLIILNDENYTIKDLL